MIAAAEGWVGASRARSPCSNTRIIYYVVILALSAGATSPTVLATKRTNSRAEVPTENAKENSPISHATRMEQGSGSPPNLAKSVSQQKIKGQKGPAPKQIRSNGTALGQRRMNSRKPPYGVFICNSMPVLRPGIKRGANSTQPCGIASGIDLTIRAVFLSRGQR